MLVVEGLVLGLLELEVGELVFQAFEDLGEGEGRGFRGSHGRFFFVGGLGRHAVRDGNGSGDGDSLLDGFVVVVGVSRRDGAFADGAVLAIVVGEEVEEVLACRGDLLCGRNAHGDVWEDEGGRHLFHSKAVTLIALFEEGVLGMTTWGEDGNLCVSGLCSISICRLVGKEFTDMIDVLLNMLGVVLGIACSPC